MPLPRTKTEIERRRKEFADLFKMGLKQQEIANAFGLSRRNINYHIAKYARS